MVALISLIIAACSRPINERNVITYKSPLVYGDELPKGMCKFVYTGDRIDDYREFIDSCHFYYVLDTLTAKRPCPHHNKNYQK